MSDKMIIKRGWRCSCLKARAGHYHVTYADGATGIVNMYVDQDSDGFPVSVSVIDSDSWQAFLDMLKA